MAVHESKHPVLALKLSQLRNAGVENHDSRRVRTLIKEISQILAIEVGSLIFTSSTSGPIASSALGSSYTYTQEVTSPSNYVLVPILRSGLSMLEPFQDLLPDPNAAVHHIGLYREKATLAPVEYYNRLPNNKGKDVDVAFVIDPAIATGGTADAAIQTLM